MKYKIRFTNHAQEDIEFYKKSNNRIVLNKINSLLKALRNNPISGLGKPEPLKHDLSGKWSRRINKEHRLIYEIQEDIIIIHSLRGHY